MEPPATDKKDTAAAESLEDSPSTRGEPKLDNQEAGESLEPTTEAEKGSNDLSTSSSASPPSSPTSGQRKKTIKDRITGINIYLLLFVLVVVIAVMVLFVAIQRSKKEANPDELTSQNLSTDAINQLKGNDIKIGDVKQTLNVESNAVFAGRILVQGSSDIAGALKVSGDVSVVNFDASGTATLQKAQVGELASSGNVGVQGQLTVQKSLNVSGGGTFGGNITTPQLTVDNLDLVKDLQLGGHIDAGGNTPSSANGPSIGSGGTSSVSGTDTAGTVTVSTGTGPSSGCFTTITFAKKFNATPHVVISASNSNAGGLDFYVNRTTTGFSVCANTPIASRNYTFDYIVVD